MEETNNGANLHQLILPKESKLNARFAPELLGGVEVIETAAYRVNTDAWEDELYQEDSEVEWRSRSSLD
uniref:Uncharacterized protein n=1 Tax=Cohnella candidum TaxID=2674991 RepID=A0A3G3JYH1_9BACL|nr:hypothetical protein EAV92_12445 [Cohnella candidum]